MVLIISAEFSSKSGGSRKLHRGRREPNFDKWIETGPCESPIQNLFEMRLQRAEAIEIVKLSLRGNGVCFLNRLGWGKEEEKEEIWQLGAEQRPKVSGHGLTVKEMRMPCGCDLRVSDGPFQLQKRTPLACFGSRNLLLKHISSECRHWSPLKNIVRDGRMHGGAHSNIISPHQQLPEPPGNFLQLDRFERLATWL